ncbi:hypothetical protein SLUN_20405 [Streptomyces lunaelactis]|uniref:Uncharacterized protein n=2 Tax=Streptomyces lunaelactis TaxID=1535768 RepID=A0A2R4T519_9ACTN|nr:hypothetical protein SLUN_20405 [Streptomyces lunaelactis]NUK88438.1 hypothetical protein [Streptomyces lunaelactis]
MTMVLLGHQTVDVHHRGPSRRTLSLALASVAAILFAGCWLVIQRHNERPPWAKDVAYEAGFIQGNRIRQYDPTGQETIALLAGGCERLQAAGQGGLKASYDPGLWVDGCLDGAAGRQPVKQGLFH